MYIISQTSTQIEWCDGKIKMDMKRTELDSNQNMQYLAISQAGDGFSTSCRTLTRVVQQIMRDVEKCVFVHWVSVYNSSKLQCLTDYSENIFEKDRKSFLPVY